jgi:hypothetical protein
MRIAVIGVGAVGARAARQLVSSDGVREVVIRDDRPERAAAVAHALGALATCESPPYAAPPDVDAAIVAVPAGQHLTEVRDLVQRRVPVVSTSDDVDELQALFDLAAEAAERGVPVVVGAAFSPGLTCVLARHAAADFDEVDEIHIAHTGTGGPDCARQHHRALGREALEWRDGGWVRRRAGSGRELCWFPDPVGAKDCYRAGLADPLVLVPAFEGVQRVTAKIAANRRDRLTARLPMLRPPHPEGGPGAVRVEVRGRRGGARDIKVLGAIDRPAVAAGAVSALTALALAAGDIGRPGVHGLAGVVDAVPFLAGLARRGVRAAVFEGAATN